MDPPPHAFHMPLLPARSVEDRVRLLRRLAAAGRQGLWALYVDTLPPHAWHAYLPPQWCGTRGVRANLSYPCVTVPRPQLRLAGKLQSAPPASADELASNLPPFDGVHLYFHPGANWLVLTAYLAIAGEPYLVAPGLVLSEPHDPDLASLSQRLWGDA
jgi:hypothetical protein